jgi:hypothetical protein
MLLQIEQTIGVNQNPTFVKVGIQNYMLQMLILFQPCLTWALIPIKLVALGFTLHASARGMVGVRSVPLLRIYPLPPSPHDLHMFRCTILRFASSFSMGKAHEWWTFTKCRV